MKWKCSACGQIIDSKDLSPKGYEYCIQKQEDAQAIKIKKKLRRNKR